MTEEVNHRIKPDFVQFIGDNVQDATESQWRLFDELRGRLDAPHFALTGDHDIKDDPAANGFRARFESTYGATLSTDRAFLVAVQLLDGVGASVLDVEGVLVIADLTRGTGRFNLMQGVLAAATGVGVSSSNLINGVVVHYAGFDAGFIALAGFAMLAWLLVQFRLPETPPSPCVAT